jgi:formate dehydrogenase (coenzyme F420) beta subunit
MPEQLQEQLRTTCRQLLEEGRVQVVIGYGQEDPAAAAHAVFITRAEDVGRLVWNDLCLPNLAGYLTRKEVRALGKAAIVVKGCDQRALAVLENESQIDRAALVVIAMACEGVGHPRESKCQACDAHQPAAADVVLGQVDNPPVAAESRYAALGQILDMSVADRMDYWRQEFARCVKCYACRQVCPLCYCERCIVDKNRPTCIDTSATLKGNFAWHITRAFHLAGRCVGCDECTRACPAGIDLRLLNLSLARTAEVQFDFRAGMKADAEPLIGSYSTADQETFIR